MIVVGAENSDGLLQILEVNEHHGLGVGVTSLTLCTRLEDLVKHDVDTLQLVEEVFLEVVKLNVSSEVAEV